MARVSKSGGYVILDDAGFIFDGKGHVYFSSNDPEFDGDGHKGVRVSVPMSPGLTRLWNRLGQPTPSKARSQKNKQ